MMACGMAADRHVAGDLAVVGVHVVDRKAQLRTFPRNRFCRLVTHEDAVAPVRMSLLPTTFAPGAFQTEMPLPASVSWRSRRPMIRLRSHDLSALRAGRRHKDCSRAGWPRPARGCRPFDENAGVHGLEAGPGAADLQAPDDASAAWIVTTLPLPFPWITAPARRLQDDLAVEPTGPAWSPGARRRTSPVGRGLDRGCRSPARRHVDRGRRGRPRRGEKPPAKTAETAAEQRMAHADRGSTSRRPRISMCMAWQNQVQKYQWTPGLVGDKGDRGRRLRADLHVDAVVVGRSRGSDPPPRPCW